MIRVRSITGHLPEVRKLPTKYTTTGISCGWLQVKLSSEYMMKATLTISDKTTLLPKVAIRDVSEGNYKLYEKMIFDQENSKITSYRGNTPKDAVKKEFRINDCMHDLISIIYHARNLEYEKFAKGQEYPIKIFMDKEVWPLSVKYKGRYKQVTVKGGTKYKAFKFSPDVISGEVFKEGTQMDIWVSDDNNRIPVYIESPVSVGSVKIVLKDYKGLKYPLTAKI
jgi:hypothetical protein